MPAEAIVYHSARCLVQRSEREAFQVLAFGMMQAYGMVDGMAESLHQRDFTLGVDGGAEDDFLKQVDGKMLGARKAEKQSARIKMLERVQVETLITTGCSGHVAALVRQRRRVQED